jgi:hypothetical protein
MALTPGPELVIILIRNDAAQDHRDVGGIEGLQLLINFLTMARWAPTMEERPMASALPAQRSWRRRPGFVESGIDHFHPASRSPWAMT